MQNWCTVSMFIVPSKEAEKDAKFEYVCTYQNDNSNERDSTLSYSEDG
jgi:hypothetical protein